MATAAQVFMLIFFFRNTMLPTGVITIYRAVIKPAFPTVVNISPYCWHNMSVIRAAAHTKAPLTVAFFFAAASWACGASFFLLSAIHTTGNIERPPKVHLTAVNPKGPRCSIPACWLTRPIPHTRAASKRNIFPLFLTAICIYLLVPCPACTGYLPLSPFTLYMHMPWAYNRFFRYAAYICLVLT